LKLRLDLHTHCREAIGFACPDLEAVQKIANMIKKKGLNGIAITDHVDKDYAFQMQELAQRYLNHEISIIPGQELNRGLHHVVELYLSDGIVFRFIAHPGYPSSRWAEEGSLDDIHGLEITNGNWDIDQAMVKEVARKHKLMLLSNSDAHHLERIGLHYNEIDLRELCTHGESLTNGDRLMQHGKGKERLTSDKKQLKVKNKEE